MTVDEIRNAVAEHLLPVIEGVNPATAAFVDGQMVVGGRAPLSLNGVSWSWNRSNDWPIADELGANLGTLCLLKLRKPLLILEMTSWQYTAYLADCEFSAVGNAAHQFTRDYAVIDEAELARYKSRYIVGAPLWGGISHGTDQPVYQVWRSSAQARPNLLTPTPFHASSFTLSVQALGPKEQYLKLYHSIELLFDYIIFRKISNVGNDLVGFGKVMSAYQKSELDKLRAIIREFCPDLTALSSKFAALRPYLDTAEAIFQEHSKDGNPLVSDERWVKFRSLIESDEFNIDGLKREKLAPSEKAREDLIVGLVSYFVYRVRSSIAHNRIGEYVMTEADDDFVASFGVCLIEEVAMQIFGSAAMAGLLSSS